MEDNSRAGRQQGRGGGRPSRAGGTKGAAGGMAGVPFPPEAAAGAQAEQVAPACGEAGDAELEEMPTMPPPAGPRPALRWATATGSAPGRAGAARQAGSQARTSRTAGPAARGGTEVPSTVPRGDVAGRQGKRPGSRAGGAVPASGRRRLPEAEVGNPQPQAEPPTLPAMTAVMPTVAPPPPNQAAPHQAAPHQSLLLRAPVSPDPRGHLPRRRHRRRLLAAALALLVGASVAVVAAVGGSSPGNARQQLAGMVSRTVEAQVLVRQAEAGVCREAAPGVASRRGAVAALSTARNLDISVTSSLAAARGSAMAGADLSVVAGELRRLASASAAVSSDLARWASDRQVAGCYSAPGNDVYFQRAKAAEAATAPLERDFARHWAELALRWHLPSFGASQL